MNYGIKTPPQHCSWQDMLDVWKATDQVDVFTSCWNFDHFYPLVGDPNGSCMEAWVTLTALAVNTQRVRVGAMVQGMPYRHPAVTANMAASLDIIAGGRLNLGLGAGWHEGECAAYGIDLLSLGQRMDRFEEGVQVVRSLLREEYTTFTGEYYQLDNARCEPKGSQRGGPPIVIGGGGENVRSELLPGTRITGTCRSHHRISFATSTRYYRRTASGSAVTSATSNAQCRLRYLPTKIPTEPLKPQSHSVRRTWTP